MQSQQEKWIWIFIVPRVHVVYIDVGLYRRLLGQLHRSSTGEVLYFSIDQVYGYVVVQIDQVAVAVAAGPLLGSCGNARAFKLRS
jgi:hypothetical protein